MLLMFQLPAVILLATALPVAAVLRDRRLDRAQRPAYRASEFVYSFYVSPRRQPGFDWAWLSRFLLFMGLATLLSYQAFYLLSKLGESSDRLPQLIFVAILVQSLGAGVSCIAGGGLSDRIGRRKVFVFASAMVQAAGLAVIAFSGSFLAFFVGMAVTGLGQGIHFAVVLALVADVLPDRRPTRPRTLGCSTSRALCRSSLRRPSRRCSLLSGGRTTTPPYSWQPPRCRPPVPLRSPLCAAPGEPPLLHPSTIR